MRTNSAGLLRFHWLKALSMAGHAGTSPPTYANEAFAALPSARTLNLDLYLPAHGRPSPLLIWIHGGAWLHGGKAEPPILPFLNETYALASIEYHFSHEATFPRQLHTCKAAVRWLRAHAQDLGYIADRIGVLGASAGGHLASCLGASNCNAEMEGTIGLHLEESSSVQAVVDLFGPTDFIHMPVLRKQHGPLRTRPLLRACFWEVPSWRSQTKSRRPVPSLIYRYKLAPSS